MLSVASMILTVAMCANLEDTRLNGFFALGIQFSRAAPLVVFAVRNLYVLGGLVFLGIVAWRTQSVSEPARDSVPASSPAVVTPATP